jgi:hypothetical protein
MCSGKEQILPVLALDYPGAPRPMPAAQLVVFSRYLIVVSMSLPRRRDAAAAGEEQLCWCAAEKSKFYPYEASNYPGARHRDCCQL